jgi:transposase
LYTKHLRSKGSAAELEQRRRLAVQRVHDGWLHKDVAAFLGVSERAVGRWGAAHRAHGDDGLQAKPAPGGKPRLTDDQALQVLACLLRPATAFGFPSDLWTSRRVAQLVADRFGVRFHPDYLREWLRQRGYSPQKPAGPARERDQAAIDRWAAQDWPRLQKKRRRKAPTSC